MHASILLAIWNAKTTVFPSLKEKQEKFTVVHVDLRKETEVVRRQIVETEKKTSSSKIAEDAFLGKRDQMVERQTKAITAKKFSSGRQGKLAHALPAELGLKFNWKPLMQDPNSKGAGPSTNDFLKDVANGAQTLLNTKEFAYFSFYQRVRLQLEQFWEPGLQQKITKMLSKGRRIASEQDHSTRLMVILNTEGSIEKIQIESTSGYLDLDEAAIEAFNKAGPFPNPPKGMRDSDGYVRVAWEFVLRS